MQDLVNIGRSMPISGCLFRIPKTGGRVLWQITNRCNYRCSYCIFSSGYGESSLELEFATICRVIDELKERGFNSIKFTGGEPFVRKDLLAILTYAAKQEIALDLSTNASLVTAPKAKQLREINLPMVHVSLDGASSDVHESVRGSRSYLPSIRGIEFLVAADLTVRIGCVVFKNNQDRLDSIVAACFNLGASEVIFSRMIPLGRLRGNTSLSSNLSDAQLHREVEQLSLKWRGKIKVSGSFHNSRQTDEVSVCPGGSRFLYIDEGGYVAPCTWALENGGAKKSLSSLRDKSLGQILEGGELRSFRELINLRASSGLLGCPYE